MSADRFTASGVFRVGDVLGRAWRIFTGNILFFLGLPALIYLAVVLAFAVATFLVPGKLTDFGPPAVAVSLAAVLALCVAAVGQAVLLLGAFQRLRGEPLRIGAALRRALARLLPLLGLAVLWILGLGICTFASLVVLSFTLWGLGTGWMLFLFALASPVALAPTAILFVTWAVVVPACVIEGLGPLASLFRSFNLTKGYRWKIFAIMFLPGLAALAGELLEPVVEPASPELAAVVSAAWFVVVVAYWNCTIIMIYHHLRVAKEGIDAGQIASIFD